MPNSFNRDNADTSEEKEFPLSTDQAWIRELIQRTAVLETTVRTAQSTLDRQAIEYERRLTELNHAHSQILQDRGMFVTRDQWDSRSRDVDNRISDLVIWKSKVIGYALGAGGATGFIASLIIKMITKN